MKAASGGRQQAVGCLLAAALSTHSLSNLAMFPFHTHADATDHAHTAYMHMTTDSYSSMYMCFQSVTP